MTIETALALALLAYVILIAPKAWRDYRSLPTWRDADSADRFRRARRALDDR